MVIITRDAKILERTAELKALREHSVRAAVIVSTGQLDTWAQLEVVVTQWRRIEALVDRAGPVVAKMTRTAFDDSALADARRTT